MILLTMAARVSDGLPLVSRKTAYVLEQFRKDRRPAVVRCYAHLALHRLDYGPGEALALLLRANETLGWGWKA